MRWKTGGIGLKVLEFMKGMWDKKMSRKTDHGQKQMFSLWLHLWSFLLCTSHIMRRQGQYRAYFASAQKWGASWIHRKDGFARGLKGVTESVLALFSQEKVGLVSSTVISTQHLAHMYSYWDKQIQVNSATNPEGIFLWMDERIAKNNTCTTACRPLQQRPSQRTWTMRLDDLYQEEDLALNRQRKRLLNINNINI